MVKTEKNAKKPVDPVVNKIYNNCYASDLSYSYLLISYEPHLVKHGLKAGPCGLRFGGTNYAKR